MKLRIIIDNDSAEVAPGTPFNLEVYRDYGELDRRSQGPMQFDDGSASLVGDSIANMLRTLADEIECGTVGEPEEFDLCSECGDWNDNGEGWNGLCGDCADRAETGGAEL